MGKQFSTKELKACSGEKKTSTINGARKNWKATCKRMKLNCYLSSYTKVNSKWIKDLNIRPKTINYMEENIGTKHMGLGIREDTMNLTSKAREVRAKINEWDYIKLKKTSTQPKNK